MGVHQGESVCVSRDENMCVNKKAETMIICHFVRALFRSISSFFPPPLSFHFLLFSLLPLQPSHSQFISLFPISPPPPLLFDDSCIFISLFCCHYPFSTLNSSSTPTPPSLVDGPVPCQDIPPGDATRLYRDIRATTQEGR